jgi:hypothetical protein
MKLLNAALRSNAMKQATLSHYSLYQLRADDKRFKLRAGDILLGCPYQLDPGKTSIALRISDGYRPECNQYNSNIRRLTEVETDRAIWGGEIEIAKSA